MILRTAAKLCLIASFAAAAIDFSVPTTASAQGFMSCDQLWYTRNQIYAQSGYCFKQARSIATFGPGCFPPYGRLSPWEERRIAEILMWERRKGCSG